MKSYMEVYSEHGHQGCITYGNCNHDWKPLNKEEEDLFKYLYFNRKRDERINRMEFLADVLLTLPEDTYSIVWQGRDIIILLVSKAIPKDQLDKVVDDIKFFLGEEVTLEV